MFFLWVSLSKTLLRMKKNNLRWGLVAFIILIFIGLTQSYYRFNSKSQIHSCIKLITIGNVTETNYIYIKTSGLWVYYQFRHRGKEYKNRCNIGLGYRYELRHKLLYKSIPVIYCNSNPNINSALITPEQFNEYGYKFPDSLNWIVKFQKK